MELELELELELDFGVLQTVITNITVNPDNLQNKEHSQLLYDSKWIETSNFHILIHVWAN